MNFNSRLKAIEKKLSPNNDYDKVVILNIDNAPEEHEKDLKEKGVKILIIDDII